MLWVTYVAATCTNLHFLKTTGVSCPREDSSDVMAYPKPACTLKDKVVDDSIGDDRMTVSRSSITLDGGIYLYVQHADMKRTGHSEKVSSAPTRKCHNYIYILLWCVSPRFLGDTHYVIICGVSP